MASSLTIGQCAELACLMEATAPKPGNVHRAADFEDTHFVDFLVSAVSIRPAMDAASDQPLGKTVLQAVRGTKERVASNTNLGIVLLLAPMAAVPRETPLETGIPRVLGSLTSDDSSDVYEAIRLAQPGGLGTVAEMDVRHAAPANLLAAMAAAQERDMIARQYVNGFRQVLENVIPWIRHGAASGWSMTETIIHTHVRFLAEFPDSLIARKCGLAVAKEAACLAARTLATGGPNREEYERALSDLDFWLRSDGHSRNPGTTADMVTAGMFAAIREGVFPPPWR